MEYYNNILCVEGGWLYCEGGIISEANYKKLTLRGYLKVIRRACYGTPALISYDSIPSRFKKLIIEKVGDPYQTTKQNQFTDHIQPDTKALSFFQSYILDDNRRLPAENINEYYANAILLNTIHTLVNNRKAKNKAMGGKLVGFWDKMADVLTNIDREKYPHTLPLNPRRLQDKCRNYTQNGYESLIHSAFCNKNSEKINDDAKMWLLARWANPVDKVANENQLLHEYNEKAKAENWKALKNANSLHLFLNRPDIKELWFGHRFGELKAKEKFAMQLSTLMPTMRDSLWYSDGTKLNYFYLTEEGKIETCQVYEVMDAYSEVFLGYHISKTEDYVAQYHAYKMAMKTAGHKPYQITYDNQGGHKKLESGDFLKRLAHLAIRTQPYNGKSKTIESAFGRFQQQVLKKDWFFTGQNITTKKDESKANLEFILANKSSLPSLAEVKAAYLKRRTEWNNAPHPRTGISRIETYYGSQNPEAPKVEMFDMVNMFWITRQKPITCNAYGLSFTEKKTEYNYMVYSEPLMPNIEWLRKNIDKEFIVKFDPDDMSLIYLYEQEATGLRFVTGAETKVEIHRGRQEQEDWEAAHIAHINSENERFRIATRDKMDEILVSQNQSVEQYGLVSPALKGIESKRKKTAPKSQTEDIAEVQKQISNMVLTNDNDYNTNVNEAMSSMM